MYQSTSGHSPTHIFLIYLHIFSSEYIIIQSAEFRAGRLVAGGWRYYQETSAWAAGTRSMGGAGGRDWVSRNPIPDVFFEAGWRYGILERQRILALAHPKNS
jgi:hypothetical protein